MKFSHEAAIIDEFFGAQQPLRSPAD